jgi:hypothetical protein
MEPEIGGRKPEARGRKPDRRDRIERLAGIEASECGNKVLGSFLVFSL